MRVRQRHDVEVGDPPRAQKRLDDARTGVELPVAGAAAIDQHDRASRRLDHRGIPLSDVQVTVSVSANRRRRSRMTRLEVATTAQASAAATVRRRPPPRTVGAISAQRTCGDQQERFKSVRSPADPDGRVRAEACGDRQRQARGQGRQRERPPAEGRPDCGGRGACQADRDDDHLASGTSARLPRGAIGAISAKTCAPSGAVATVAASVAAPKRRATAGNVPDGSSGARRKRAGRAERDPRDRGHRQLQRDIEDLERSGDEEDQRGAGDRGARDAARLTSNAPIPSANIRAERSVATASPATSASRRDGRQRTWR